MAVYHVERRCNYRFAMVAGALLFSTVDLFWLSRRASWAAITPLSQRHWKSATAMIGGGGLIGIALGSFEMRSIGRLIGGYVNEIDAGREEFLRLCNEFREELGRQRVALDASVQMSHTANCAIRRKNKVVVDEISRVRRRLGDLGVETSAGAPIQLGEMPPTIRPLNESIDTPTEGSTRLRRVQVTTRWPELLVSVGLGLAGQIAATSTLLLLSRANKQLASLGRRALFSFELGLLSVMSGISISISGRLRALEGEAREIADNWDWINGKVIHTEGLREDVTALAEFSADMERQAIAPLSLDRERVVQ